MGTLRFLFVTVLALAFALTPSVKANECSFTDYQGALQMNLMAESADSVLDLGHPTFAFDKDRAPFGIKVEFIGPPATSQDKGIVRNSDGAVFGSVDTSTTSKSIGKIFIDHNSHILRFNDGRISGVVSMPEPATLLLLGSGLTGIGARSWLKRRARKR